MTAPAEDQVIEAVALRRWALELALGHRPDGALDTVIMEAREFLKFLKGESK